MRNIDGNYRWFQIYNQPFYNIKNQFDGYIGIGIDIHEKKMADILLIKAKVEAEKASIAKSEFLANISHEIRTPINGIVGMIDLTLLTDINEEQRENLITAKTCAGSLVNAINDILDFSKMEAGKLKIWNVDFDITELMDRITKAHIVSAKEKGLELSYSYESHISSYLFGDPNRLQQILNNLIKNAIKFTEDGEIHINLRVKIKNELQFSVKDTGIGIAYENQDLLFKRFSQVDGSNTRKFGGTGLGLIISKQLLELMGGRIWVESEQGKGSIFYFTIPYIIGHKPREDSEQYLIVEDVMNSLNILIVEDDPVNQLVLSRMLKEKGHTVDIVFHGQEALDYYNNSDYDLILMDIQMPEMYGVVTTARIRDIERRYGRKYTPIIALTAYALQGDRDKFLSLGMDEYISKPIQIAELLCAIGNVMQQRNKSADDIDVKITDNKVLVLSENNEKNNIDKLVIYKKLSGLMSDLEKALKKNDFTALKNYAKIIKELYNQLDMDELKSTAFRIELAARRGNIEEVIRYSIQIQREFKLSIKSIDYQVLKS